METKGVAFRRLHERPGAFLIPNPWDLGSARILEAMGFEALATTSAGLAFALGRREGTVRWEATLEHCRTLAASVAVPVSADLERGIGDTPAEAARTVREAAGAGLAGCSLEDHTGRADAPIYEFSLAVERIAAAAQARDALPQDFVLTARCENFLWGRPDLDDTIARLRAYEAAGADVLYAPGLTDLATIRTVCSALARPVNVLMPGGRFSLRELGTAGVKRVSIGSTLARIAYGAFIGAARELREQGTFSRAADAAGFAEIEAFFTGGDEA